MSHKDQKYVSVREAATLLGISRVHVLRLIHAGKLPAQKIGHAYAINRNDIGGIYKQISSKEKAVVQKAIEKTLKEYGDVIRRLGKE